MNRSRAAVVALLLVLAGLATIAVVSAAPPPTQLCGSCGSDLEGASEPGTLDIHIDDEGDSQWIERVPVTDDAAARYRDDPDALEGSVDDAWARWHVVDGDLDRTATLEDETVTVTYEVDDIARPDIRDGWIVDYFALEYSNHRYELAAGRVTIHTPEGTTVTNNPAHASVEGDTATWAPDDDRDEHPPAFDRRTYVTYGSSGVLASASGYATVALEIGPDAIEQGVIGGLVPGLFLTFVGLAVGRVDLGVRAFDAAGLERLFVTVGAIGAVSLPLVSVATTGRPFFPGLGALGALGVGYAALGVAARRTGLGRDAHGLTRLAVLVTLATGTLLWLLGGLFTLAVVPFGLAAALFLPIGYASETSSWPVVPLVLAGLAPMATAILLALFFTPSGFGVFFYWIIVAVWAGIVVVFGYPLGLLGRRLATDRRTVTR
ncbi:hypothetical protein HALLA_08860 [Halostagnicola larsenii XH-48]|uniref:Uncharacterized protein n=1 Tax=Halostagnicola larsenii XH-48 TaxID=797299 RepID=W0JJP6_9EURY|nr:hypothetical protein [Halostagnicola larsenii]AHF98960.1 hypothetical protein HALLA_08860 [Halostagnicola larsenii XH-48]